MRDGVKLLLQGLMSMKKIFNFKRHFVNDSQNKRFPSRGRFSLFNETKNFTLEYNIGSHFCHIGFDVDDESWTFRLAFPYICAFWFSFAGFKILDKIAPKRTFKFQDKDMELIDERECNISIHDWAIWINPWSKRMEYSGEDPWWIRGIVFHIDDFFLGKYKYSEKILKKDIQIDIPIDGRNYKATYCLEKKTWERKRFPFWPFKKERIFSRISIDKGIPFNGKGENSWDCGIDGLFGCSVEIKDMDDPDLKSIYKVIEEVMDSRRKYGTPSSEEIESWNNR